MKTTNAAFRVLLLKSRTISLSCLTAGLMICLFVSARPPLPETKSLPAPKLEIGLGNMYVYQDFGSTENHFLVKALISSSGKEANVKRLNENRQTDPYSGNSCIECSIDLEGDSWGGWLFTYGHQPKGGGDWQLNFGKYPDSGYDLSKAKKLTFMAKGKQGGEQVEFFMAGLGWHAENGQVLVDADYPDSSPKISTRSTQDIILGKEWKEYTILLDGADLSYISCGFGFVASGNYNKGNVTFYVDEIKYLSGKTDAVSPAPHDTIQVGGGTPGGSGGDTSFWDSPVLVAVITGIFGLLGTFLYFILRRKHHAGEPKEME